MAFSNTGTGERGLTFVEILIVVAILGILFVMVFVGVNSARKKSQDVKVRNDVRQLRLLAEEVFDNAGASYLAWTTNPLVAAQVATLVSDLVAAHGIEGAVQADYVSLIDSRESEFCVSGKLVVPNNGDYWCVDASGRFFAIDSPCAEPANASEPLTCPESTP
ncbi:MAG: type II secretion system protein [Candidatus Sungbacteria bacterium]|nr:type II secretion system protein [Candidatus Sungbacteria bacterium]